MEYWLRDSSGLATPPKMSESKSVTYSGVGDSDHIETIASLSVKGTLFYIELDSARKQAAKGCRFAAIAHPADVVSHTET
jgi:hypothetical protein